jgi:tetratricopeptide (TPR) repeat protein
MKALLLRFAPLLILLSMAAVACSDSEPVPTPSPIPTSTPVPTATSEPTATPEPTAIPEPTATPELNALFSYTSAVLLLRASLYEEAIPQFGLVIRRLPDFAEAYYGRGVAYFHEELLAPALEDLTRAIELKPELADAYSARADVYEAQEEYDKAIRDLEEAIDAYDNFRHAEKIEEAHQRLDAIKWRNPP